MDDRTLAWPLKPAIKTYLAAIGAVAIYVSADNWGKTVGIGVARDLDQALRRLRLVAPTAHFNWIAWGTDYDKLIEISQVPDLIYVNGVDGIRVRRQWQDLATLIQQIALENCVMLTPHARVIERAKTYAVALDDAIAAMQQAGAFKTFNQAYKAHRLEFERKGESAPPYWAVMADLRAVIVRMLVEHGKNAFSSDLALEQIRKRFPWFTRFRKNGRLSKPKQAIDRTVKMQ